MGKKQRLKLFIAYFFVCVILLNQSEIQLNASSTTVALLGLHDEDGADRYSWMDSVKSHFESNTSYTVIKRNYFTASEMNLYLQGSRVFIIHTHGVNDGNGLKAVNSNGDISYLWRSNISSLSSTSMSNLRVCFLGACKSGSFEGNSSTSLVHAIRSRGAKCVIGYNQSVGTVQNRTFIEGFGYCIGRGETVSNALAWGDWVVKTTCILKGNTDDRYVLGNTSIVA